MDIGRLFGGSLERFFERFICWIGGVIVINSRLLWGGGHRQPLSKERVIPRACL